MGMELVALPQPHSSSSFLSPKKSPEPLPVWLEDYKGSYGSCVDIFGGKADQISLGWAFKGIVGNISQAQEESLSQVFLTSSESVL